MSTLQLFVEKKIEPRNVGRIFIKEYMYLEKKNFFSKTFGRKSCKLCRSIIKYIDNFATYISCYLLRSGQFLA